MVRIVKASIPSQEYIKTPSRIDILQHEGNSSECR